MQLGEYEKMYRLEDHYWWFVGRRTILRRLLKGRLRPNARLLDVGCGTGATMEFLTSFGKPVGVDVAAPALVFCRKRGVGPLIRSDAHSLAVATGSVDVVVALDLFEHLAQDEEAVRECWRVCRAGGFLVFTVPAYDFLWSEHDEALHHLRRYTIGEVRSKLAGAGFQNVHLSHAIVAAFGPVVLFRTLQKLCKRAGKPKTSLIELPSLLNRALVWSLWLEAWLLRRISFPFGVNPWGGGAKGRRRTSIGGRNQQQGAGARRMIPGKTALVAVGLISVAVAVTAWPSFMEPPGRDQGVFSYVADGMLRGYAPYRDSWDLKPPGVYLTYAVAFLVGGRSVAAVRALDVACALGTSVLVWLVGVRYLGKGPALAAAILLASSSFLLFTFWSRSQAESFLVLFLVLCYWLALHDKWLGSGVAAALVLWYKTPWLLGVLPVVLLCKAASLRRLVAGAFLGVAAVLGYLALTGGLREMLETVFLFNKHYVSSRLDISLLHRIPWETGRFFWRGIILAPLAAVGFWRGSPRWAKWWLLGSLASVWVQGKLFVYHWVPVLAPLCLLAGAGVGELARGRGRLLAAGVLAVVIAAGVPGNGWVKELYPLYHHYRRSLAFGAGRISRHQYLAHSGGRGWGSSFSYTDDEQLASLIRRKTTPDETTLIWGFEPLVNFLAARRSPSRFSFDYPLTFPPAGPAAARLRERNRRLFMTELRRSPPSIVAIACGDVNPVEALDSLAQLGVFPELRAFLTEGYRRTCRVGHFVVLERRPGWAQRLHDVTRSA
jgi:SAM-dependent methyltransferase